jgi:uncharacterized repeat protein (TIGR03837 family)
VARPGRRWDVFCRVVDNYGDAAVCWRLARQLAREHGARVRLWIDRPEVLQALAPAIAGSGVDVRQWTSPIDFDKTAEIAIDAFGDGLPEDYARALAPEALWIKLEYLSAEDWVASHHGLASPHPTLPVRRYFFFPGFEASTGGLLREHDLLARRDAFDAAAFWSTTGCAPTPGATVVSLFGYENAAVAPLLEAWIAGPAQTWVAATDSRIRPQVEAIMGRDRARGRLEIRTLPFLPQERYDELLWACDWNFVRGEDSFVRAQWAAKPFCWQIYPQAEDAHRPKLEAFLGRYGGGPRDALGRLWRAWNGFGGDVGEAWRSADAVRPALAAQARRWAEAQAALPDLAENLAEFCESRLK